MALRANVYGKLRDNFMREAPNITRKSLSATEHDLRVEVVQHRLIATKLSILRNKTTALEEFRRNLQELSMLLLGEAARAWETAFVEIERVTRDDSDRNQTPL